MSEKNNVKIENLPGSQVKIIITVPADRFEKHIQQAAEELSNNLKIDGFRPGKIPRNIVEKNIGMEKLLYEGAEKAIRKHYADVILDNKIEAIGQPKVVIKKIAKNNDLEFEATATVMPKVELENWQDEVRKINKDFSGKKTEAKPEEVQRELDFLAKQRAKIITVNREAKNGDQLEIDFEVSVGGVPIEGGTAKKHQVIIGEGKFIPGFEENLVGLKTGREKEFELEFPEDYHQKNIAGKKAKFRVKIHLVQQRQVPKINDEFAKGIGKFENLQQLKDSLRKGIEHEIKHRNKDSQRRKIIDVLIKKTQAEIPHLLIDSEVGRMMGELEQEIARLGLDKQTYFQQAGTSEQKMKEQWKKEAAPNRVKSALALRQISKQQKIIPEPKEIQERMNLIFRYYKNEKDLKKKMDLESLYEMVKGELVNEKVLEYLMKL